jgi:hypothetical protein
MNPNICDDAQPHELSKTAQERNTTPNLPMLTSRILEPAADSLYPFQQNRIKLPNAIHEEVVIWLRAQQFH